MHNNNGWGLIMLSQSYLQVEMAQCAKYREAFVGELMQCEMFDATFLTPYT